MEYEDTIAQNLRCPYCKGIGYYNESGMAICMNIALPISACKEGYSPASLILGIGSDR